jgi:hypothetical protein
MNEVVKIEIPVEPETARALDDPRRMQAIGRLVDRMVGPVRNDDPLAAVLDAMPRSPTPISTWNWRHTGPSGGVD